MQKIISAKPSLLITGLPNGPLCVAGPASSSNGCFLNRVTVSLLGPISLSQQIAYSHAQNIF